MEAETGETNLAQNEIESKFKYDIPQHDYTFNKIFIFPTDEITKEMQAEGKEHFENIDVDSFDPPRKLPFNSDYFAKATKENCQVGRD